jgi:hypothetical protein
LLERQTGHRFAGSARSSLSTSSDLSYVAAADALAAATATLPNIDRLSDNYYIDEKNKKNVNWTLL